MGKAARQALPTPARIQLRRIVAVIAGGLMLTGIVHTSPSSARPVSAAATVPTTTQTTALTGSASTAPAGAPGQAASGSETAAIAITSLSPSVPSESDTLTINGTVTNKGRSTITGSHVGVRLGLGGQALSSRSDLEAVSKRTAYVAADGDEISKRQVDLAAIPSGVSRPFALQVPVKDLKLGGNGVYQLGVSLTGRTGGGFTQILGIERTFLPWYPDHKDTEHTQLSLAWPLIGRAHMDARTESDNQQTPIFRDDELTAELAPGGRLQQLVAIGKSLPVTWVIDPDLLATVDAMANGYRVANDTGTVLTAKDEATADESEETEDETRPGTGTDLAKRWLHELRQAVQDKPVVAVPFGDPDLASIAHQGKEVPGTLEHLKSATELAWRTTETVLGVRPRTDVAWPAEGAVDNRIVEVARAGGADKVIASSSSLGSDKLIHTPNAVRPVGGGTTALVADDGLSRAFTGDMSRAGNATLAIQDFLAQSLMITLESPNRQRSLLVTPQRRLGVSAAQALAEAFSAARSGNWVTSVQLSNVEAAKPDPGADHTVPSTRSYPERLRKQELSPQAFRQVQETQTELQGFVVILSEEDRVNAPLGTAILRSMSDSWRGDPAGAEAYRSSVHNYLTGLKGLVSIVDKSLNTLSGSSGTLQVTVENNLAQQITLKLHLTSGLPYRFTIDADENAQTVTIDGERKKTLKFPTTATTSGKVWVTAQLYSPDGALYGEPMAFQVNVTSVTGTVLAVIACGMLLLMLALVRMYRQRKRTTVLAQEDDERGEAEESDEDDDSSEFEASPEFDASAATDEASGGDEAPGTDTASGRGQEGVKAAAEQDQKAVAADPQRDRERADRTAAGAADPTTVQQPNTEPAVQPDGEQAAADDGTDEKGTSWAGENARPDTVVESTVPDTADEKVER